MSQTLLKALQNPALYDHPVSDFTLMETHISWVLLTGDYVYKIKKPVNFGFLDYSTLEQRKHFCNEEVRLNQRLAPSLYLGVVPVRGSIEEPSLEGDGPVIEYLVKTRQFRQQDLLGNMQREGRLENRHIDELATTLADFHARIDHATLAMPYGNPDQVHMPVAQNFEQIRPFLSAADDIAQLDQLEQWANTTFQRLTPQLAERKTAGLVRECHGDIYLDNVTLVDGQVTLFDCIEFNEAFRWTDVMADVGFMAMDLEDRGLHGLAQRFVSVYMESSGDYEGLAVLNYYKAYRAMVRAKVALFGLSDDCSEEQRQQVMQRYRSYTNLAEHYTEVPARFGLLTFGLSGTGKSTLAQHLVGELGAIRIRSDRERKRLFGSDDAQTANAGLYSPERSAKTYDRLASLASLILGCGFPVIVDATHLKRAQRQQMRDAIELQCAPCLILHCDVPLATVAQWIEQRRAQGSDPSDATLQIVEQQQQQLEPLDDQEQQLSLSVDTSSEASMLALSEQLKKRL
ncbi:MAG: AAA family ATPase [Halopseudomonas sp.]|uniref:bifunctional aminoglycoside phosphotransferase/ATP-binding protein n=1 Tax=Halopseudomonas sp. TaxID=2901191 RepID=UPI0030037E6E